MTRKTFPSTGHIDVYYIILSHKHITGLFNVTPESKPFLHGDGEDIHIIDTLPLGYIRVAMVVGHELI